MTVHTRNEAGMVRNRQGLERRLKGAFHAEEDVKRSRFERTYLRAKKTLLPSRLGGEGLMAEAQGRVSRTTLSISLRCLESDQQSAHFRRRCGRLAHDQFRFNHN